MTASLGDTWDVRQYGYGYEELFEMAQGHRPHEMRGARWADRLAHVVVFLTALVAVGMWPGCTAFAQVQPQPVPTATAAEPAASTLDLTTRVTDLEAYITNSPPKAVSSPGPGHNAWMMASTALVLFMTLPGLALFYGGLVRRKNVLSVMAQCLGCAGLVTILWWLVGYSLTFSGGSPLLGGLKFVFLRGVGATPNNDYAAWVSHSAFAMYQLMFAIITPALIVGAIAERMKYAAIMTFIGGWMFVVYFPLAHMVWGVDGLMNGVWNAKASIKAIDFAGGTVVHMSSGCSALVLCLKLGKRAGFGQKAFYPHSLVLTVIGTGMLWVGWYGFNAGSALAADGIAAGAFMATTLATAVAAVVWPALEWVTRGKPTVLGFCSGVVAGLVVITPASGFVTANGAMFIGVLAGAIPYLACTKVKAALGYDDALDTFGVHGVGGTLGALVTGFLATLEANPNLKQNLSGLVGNTLWIEQIKAIGVTLGLAVAGTAILATAVKATIGLRLDPEGEEEGLDQQDHGEAGYHLDDAGSLAETRIAGVDIGGWMATARSAGVIGGAGKSTAENDMKRIEAILRPSKLDEVKDALSEVGIAGMTVSETKGFGRTRGRKEVYRGSAYVVDFVPKVMVEIVAPDNLVAPIIEAIMRSAKTGKIGDGKIFVSDILEAIRIRTGQHGEEAI